MKDQKAQIEQLQKDLRQRELTIQGKDEDIAQRNGRIEELQDELQLLIERASGNKVEAIPVAAGAGGSTGSWWKGRHAESLSGASPPALGARRAHMRNHGGLPTHKHGPPLNCQRSHIRWHRLPDTPPDAPHTTHPPTT